VKGKTKMKNKKGIIIVILIAVLLIVTGIIAKYIYDAYDYKRSINPDQSLSTETENQKMIINLPII
jgi:uncharacterized membrane-anchored protein